MTKKMWSLLLTGALIAGVFSAVPAQAAPQIPEVANIEDQASDANGHSPVTGQATPGSLRAADFLKVWFTHDAENFYTHILTDGAVQLDSIMYQIYLDPGVGADCLQIRGYTAGSNNDAYSRVFTDGDCTAVDERFEGGIVSEETEETQGLHTITIPRSSSEYFADGTVLSIPNAYSRPHIEGVASSGFFDNTAEGTAYTISSGGAPTSPPVVSEPPGKNDPPGQGNQNCSKIKNKKKKKACKKNNGKGPKGGKCAAYVPGEEGAEAELITVTSAATAEAPVETQVSMDPAVGLFTGDLPVVGPNPATSQTFYNFQVDSDKPTDGLYIRLDFGLEEDYDIYLNNADGTEAAHVGGFNTAPNSTAGTDGTGNGGHSEQGAEQIDGVLTPDCGGYTLKIANAFGLGEPVMTSWLGDATWDPASQAAIPAKAFVF